MPEIPSSETANEAADGTVREELAIVILNYNGLKYLRDFLPGLVKYSHPHPVYVADNASTDESVAYLKVNHPEVRLILLEENHGYAGGYNQALRQIAAEYLILINSDVEVTPNWVDPLLSTMKTSPDIAACQPKIRAFRQKDHFEYAGAAGGYIDRLGYPFCKGRLFDNLERDEGQYDADTDIFWATGACFMIRKELFHALGEFDPQFFAHMEEIDLCWRIQNEGLKIRYCHQSVVYHVGGGTLSSDNPRKTYLNFRNGLLILVKNLPIYQLIFKLPVRSILDLVAAFKFISDGNPKHAWAVGKAHWHAAIPALQHIWRHGFRFAPSNNTYISNKLVVFEYFIRGKKKFSDIRFKWVK
mgnify:CR=1 FL=1